MNFRTRTHECALRQQFCANDTAASRYQVAGSSFSRRGGPHRRVHRGDVIFACDASPEHGVRATL